eukprot:14320072-Alexandrium_andersonii.AAC.1
MTRGAQPSSKPPQVVLGRIGLPPTLPNHPAPPGGARYHPQRLPWRLLRSAGASQGGRRGDS